MELEMAVVLCGDCQKLLEPTTLREHGIGGGIALTFLDPPFNQGKDYAFFDDELPSEQYWQWLEEICAKVYALTAEGGAIYFMHREKNAEQVLRLLRETGWTLQNLIVWQKRTSAVPNAWRYGKAYQIIAFATKGRKPRTFHRLRIDAPLRPEHRYEREHGMFVTDVWDDIRELTSGYFAGEEALRHPDGSRVCPQQSPIALLLRILLASTRVDDWVLDPFAGTGTTLVVAGQLKRRAVGIEIDPKMVEVIRWRLNARRPADSIAPFRHYYRFTPNLDAIWPADAPCYSPIAPQTLKLFER
jgi:site-specific DNA-methyltransferase (adenine-specific)